MMGVGYTAVSQERRRLWKSRKRQEITDADTKNRAQSVNNEDLTLIGPYKWLTDQEREEYAKIIIEGIMEEKIRKATSTGRPLCGERFFDTLEAIVNRDLKPKKGEGCPTENLNMGVVPMFPMFPLFLQH
jgi:hypothetical protein